MSTVIPRNRPQTYLARLRRKHGLRLLDVSQRTGINFSTVASLECGISPMSEDKAIKLAALYGMTLVDMLAKSGKITKRCQVFIKNKPEAAALLQLLADRPRIARWLMPALIDRLESGREVKGWRLKAVAIKARTAPFYVEPAPATPTYRKPFCKRGHPFNDANTHTNSKGHRFCRPCHATYERERQKRVREASK
jgi:transcriptional regulator with XRE-family HTH domain